MRTITWNNLGNSGKGYIIHLECAVVAANSQNEADSPDMSSPGNGHDQKRHQVNGDFCRQQELNALPQLLHVRKKQSARFHLKKKTHIRIHFTSVYLSVFHLCVSNR